MPETEQPTWVVMPFRDQIAMTLQAIDDVLQQSVPTRVLLIDQGSEDDETRRVLDRRLVERSDNSVIVWHYDPPLSLGAAWNRAMAFIAEVDGHTPGPNVWIVNNDVRLHPDMLEALTRGMHQRHGLFVSGIGVTPGPDAPKNIQHGPASEVVPAPDPDVVRDFGGPDFSCFLIAMACWRKFPFEERFWPAYCEDLDYTGD